MQMTYVVNIWTLLVQIPKPLLLHLLHLLLQSDTIYVKGRQALERSC